MTEVGGEKNPKPKARFPRFNHQKKKKKKQRPQEGSVITSILPVHRPPSPAASCLDASAERAGGVGAVYQKISPPVSHRSVSKIISRCQSAPPETRTHCTDMYGSSLGL